MKKGTKQMKEFVSKLSEKEKEELMKLIKESLNPSVEGKKREIGKYEGKIFISDDFNEILSF
jgi:hypothetical protein